jgi:hypothetical protein
MAPIATRVWSSAADAPEPSISCLTVRVGIHQALQAGRRQPIHQLHAAGRTLRFERMRLIDLSTLEIQITIYDDTIFKKPYALSPRKFIRGIEHRNDPQEWACTDNRA